MSELRLSVVVPTVGSSPWLADCVRALRRDGGTRAEILLVAQGIEAGSEGARRIEAAEEWVDRVLHRPSNEGFAAANNVGMAASRAPFIATVNDDAIIEDGWCSHLLAALEEEPELAAVQGIQVSLENPAIVDGAGVAWNPFWQAVQLGYGKELRTIPEAPVEIFGVSATAAIYRREALQRVAGEDFEVFDRRLFAYYEDVDLASRLRAAGFRSLLVPAARARHAGSLSGRHLSTAGAKWIHGNRHLVLARLLGRSFWPRWPWIALRDAIDFFHAARRGNGSTMAGILAGAGRAFLHMPGFAHLRAPGVPLMDLKRFQKELDVETTGIDP